MSPREESVLEYTKELAKSVLKIVMVGTAVSAEVKVETADGIKVSISVNVGK